MRLSRKNISGLKDEELVSLFCSKKEAYLIGELYERYNHLTYFLCRRLLKDNEAAKDAVMDIFESLYVKLPAHNIKNFKMWLYAVTKNHCLMILRRDDDSVSLDNISQNKIDLEMEIDNVLHLNTGTISDGEVRVFIERLEDVQRECVRLFYLEGASYNLIAEKLNIDYKKVKSSIQSGRKNLKKMIEKHLRNGNENNKL